MEKGGIYMEILATYHYFITECTDTPNLTEAFWLLHINHEPILDRGKKNLGSKVTMDHINTLKEKAYEYYGSRLRDSYEKLFPREIFNFYMVNKDSIKSDIDSHQKFLSIRDEISTLVKIMDKLDSQFQDFKIKSSFPMKEHEIEPASKIYIDTFNENLNSINTTTLEK